MESVNWALVAVLLAALAVLLRYAIVSCGRVCNAVSEVARTVSLNPGHGPLELAGLPTTMVCPDCRTDEHLAFWYDDVAVYQCPECHMLDVYSVDDLLANHKADVWATHWGRWYSRHELERLFHGTQGGGVTDER